MAIQTPSMKRLTGRQAAFVEAFVSNGGKRTEAAKTAGYSKRFARQQAYELLTKPHIQAALAERVLLSLATPESEAQNPLHSLLAVRSERIALAASLEIVRRHCRPSDAHDSCKKLGSIKAHIDLS